MRFLLVFYRLTSHSTQTRSFIRRSSEQISWLSAKSNTTRESNTGMIRSKLIQNTQNVKPKETHKNEIETETNMEI